MPCRALHVYTSGISIKDQALHIEFLKQATSSKQSTQ